MQTILITGGTGLVGGELSSYFVQKGYEVIILSRSPSAQKEQKGISFAAWDIDKEQIDLKAIQKADFIVHLAGAPVMDKRWTSSYKNEILESRTKSSLLLTKTLANNSHHVQAIISSSAIGWYGPDEHAHSEFTEADPAAADFLGQTCLQWEQSIETAEKIGIRVCKLRTGIVLSANGGALEEFVKPLKFGVATVIGSGKQVISWIHILDLCKIFHHAIVKNLSGSYNAVAPKPVSNKQLVLTLAKLMRGNFFIPVHAPVAILKLMLGQRSVEILKSATVSAEKIMNTGYSFSFPDIKSALADIKNSKK